MAEERWFGRLKHWFWTVAAIVRQLAALDKRLTDSMRTQARLLKILIEMARFMPDKENQESFARQFLELYAEFVDDSLNRESLSGNPLTPDEVERLREYYLHVKDGGWLDEDQARDFAMLARQLEKDRASKGLTDIGAIVLAGVAGLILGYVLGAKD